MFLRCHRNRFLSSFFLSPPLYLALVPLGILVVIDADKEDVTSIIGNFLRIILVLDLADGSLSVLVVLQFYDESWRRNVLARNEHKVSIALACWVFPVYVIVVSGIILCQADDAGQRILVVIAQNAGIV